jgi:hypothetical protein
MKHTMEEILKPGSVALGLGLMLTTLCQAQNWSSEQNLQGSLLSNPATAQIPSTNILQVFYQGGDNAMWTQWRNTDGTWSSEQSLGGQMWSPPPPPPSSDSECNSVGSPCPFLPYWGAPVPIQIPNTNYLEVFYRGSDSQLWAFQRDPNGNWWPQDFGGSLLGDPAAVQVPGTDVIQVFYMGWDGSLKTQFGNLNSWTGEQGLGGQLFQPTCGDVTNSSCSGDWAVPVAVQIPDTNYLEIFYRGSDNTLHANIRTNQGNWIGDFSLGGTLSSNPSAQPVPGTNQIQVFYRGVGYADQANSGTSEGGALMTQWGNLNSWTGETQMAGMLEGYWCSYLLGDLQYCASNYDAYYAVPKSYVDASNNLWVFYPGQDGGVLYHSSHIYAQERYPDGTWSGEMDLGSTPTGDIIPTYIPGTSTLQIFYQGNSCNFFSCQNNYLGTMWYAN